MWVSLAEFSQAMEMDTGLFREFPPFDPAMKCIIAALVATLAN